MRELPSQLIELDELWSFVGKKQKRLKPEDSAELGECYVFVALDAISKAIIAHRAGKRDQPTTRAFIADLRDRVSGAPQISSDAFPAYEGAVAEFFGDNVHYGQIVKSYRGEPPVTAARRYSPSWVVGVEKQRVVGFPPDLTISTSYVERQNLTVRMQSRRFTRLTNRFSKRLDNHAAAVSLYVAHYNLCRVHQTLGRITPAMALGIADHVWPNAELIEAAEAAESEAAPEPPSQPKRPQFRVIQGGRA